MKQIYLFIVFILLLAACGPSNSVSEEEATAGAPLLPEDGSVQEEGRTTLEEAPVDGYPETEMPAETAVPEEYPIATVPPQSDSAYPAPEGSVWIARPVGVQCEDPKYSDIQDAITDLTAIGVEVTDSGTFELATASVCGGPTSTHFRVLVSAEDVQAAAALGWEPIDG